MVFYNFYFNFPIVAKRYICDILQLFSSPDHSVENAAKWVLKSFSIEPSLDVTSLRFLSLHVPPKSYYTENLNSKTSLNLVFVFVVLALISVKYPTYLGNAFCNAHSKFNFLRLSLSLVISSQKVGEVSMK